MVREGAGRLRVVHAGPWLYGKQVSRMNVVRHTGLLLVALIAFAGCATKVAEFRNPTTGDIGRCIPNREAAMMGALAMMGDGDRYASCKPGFERSGYVCTPEGQESEGTRQVIRDIDAARAASIKK
jgi:hypothetical protein